MASDQSRPKLSLLIVEDDKMALNIIVRMVGMEFPGCTIRTAENGIIGVQLYKELPPDIVLTDINMPQMGGIEMAREIRSIDVNATFIVMTAYSDKDLLERFREIGFCVYLLKPLNFEELFAGIKKCSAGMKQQG